MIVIHPWAKPLRNGSINPKNYPYWEKLVKLIDEPVVQVGVTGEQQLVEDFRKNLSIKELENLINECRTWVAVDSFFQHLAWSLSKPGVVLWGQSDPEIFGHNQNINLLKDRKYLRERQFWLWEQATYRDDCWVTPEEVIMHLK